MECGGGVGVSVWEFIGVSGSFCGTGRRVYFAFCL